ncbi:lysosomal-trafficking regulator [Rhagoletis pomonella]|uniref:lysosomal-trafficking regulator n=1 Tax=Rhagoletis pomonella TaxID=28610 RepID=UPI00177A7C86|nr:lysosomal-trafficking regulator [Rhagoletis pomonella]
MQQEAMEAEGSTYMLVETLSVIWKNYLSTGDDREAKLHWMELFLFYFQYVEEDALQSEVLISLLNNIPEETTSYLLETVCCIINKSHLSISSCTAESNSTDLVQDEISKLKSDVNSFPNNKSFTPLILNAPSDWSKIVALRSFLTHSLGKHLLRFLLRVDTKLIASQKGLCTLCIKLFPNCKWNTADIKLDSSPSILTVIAKISPFQCPNLRINRTTTNKSQFESLSSQQIEKELDGFKSSIASSDEIAFLVIQLMSKCVSNECEDNLNPQSISVLSLNFALECLCGSDEMYSTEQNACKIKYELLQLIIRCINNIFNASSGLTAVQFQNVFSKLATILQKHAIEVVNPKSGNFADSRESASNNFNIEFLSATNYVLFYILQNIISHLHKLKRPYHDLGSKSSLNDFKFVDENVIDVSIETFQNVLQNLNTNTDGDAEASVLLMLTFKALIKIIDQLFKNDQLVMNNSIHPIGGHARRRRHLFRQVHCWSSQAPTLSCFFQGTLLNLLSKISVDMQEYAVRYLLRIGICCCHYTINTYATCLDIVLALAPKYQNYIYKFLHRKILCTIFSHGGLNKHQAENCAKCDTKLKSPEFRKEVLQLYKQLHEKLVNGNEEICNKLTALQLLLKHLKCISDTLNSDIAAGILAELILPAFRKFKSDILKSRNSNKAPSNEKLPQSMNRNSPITASADKNDETPDATLICFGIVQDCLNIFVAYLEIDIRLIKAFYNEENISHLEDLFGEPTLVHSICDLIKIGIDNMAFLGESSKEQTVLSQRLIMLLLKSGREHALQFNALLDYSNNSAASKDKKAEEPDISRAPDILYAAALQWSFTYELFQTSQCFFNAFSAIYNLNKNQGMPIDHDDSNPQRTSEPDCSPNALCNDKGIDDILTLNYNALCTFLQLSQRKSTIASKPTRPHYHINTSTSPPIQSTMYTVDPEAIKEDCCLSSSLETLLSSIEVDAMQQTVDSVSLSIASNAATIAGVNASSLHGIQRLPKGDSTSQISLHLSTEAFNLSFLDTLKHHKSIHFEDLYATETEIGDYIVIYDVRNQVSSHAVHNSALSITTATLNASSVGTLANTTVWNCAADALSTSTVVVGPETRAAVLNIGTSIIGKLFSVIGSIFGGASYANSVSDLNNSTKEECLGEGIDPILICLLESSSDSKRYLLRLFEATLAIAIKGFKQEGAEAMDRHLLKLKSVILKSAISNWSQTHTEERTRENAVVKALHSLLRIAEQYSTSKALADFNESTDLDNTASEDAALQSTLRPRARSFTSTKTHGKNSNATTPRTPVPKRPISGESCDADYFSTRMSVFCESEMELSENEHDDNYITADEGYEADGEIPEISESETELDKAEFWNSFQPSSRYRTHLLHDGLCQLVVEILIELSERCIHNPVGWSDCLVQLANRLFVIRAHIGDSLFLLRGFAPVLKCGDPRLRELQQALLELIMDINTPEVICTYFNILSAKNPPVDLLIRYLNHKCGSKLKKPQPMVELEFPMAIDGKCTSTSDQRLTMEIDRIRNQHINAQATTPLSRTPCIIPITHARLWGNDGFTLSFWLQLKGTNINKPSSLIAEDDQRSSLENNLKTHIVSIGTNQVMLSVYVDSNMKLVFETSKPNAEIQTQAQSPSEPANGNMEEKNQSSAKDAVTDSKTPTPLVRPTSASTSPSTLRVALKQTKLVILNSFNNMHLFKYHNHHHSYENSSVELKLFRCTRNSWTHVAFGVCAHQDHLELTVYIDGVEEDVINLHFRNIRSSIKSHAFQIICLGDSAYSVISSNGLGDNTESQRLNSEGYPIPFSISNLMLFSNKFAAWETIANLTAMGPDFSELAPLQVNSWQPNYGFVNLSKLKKANFGSVAESIKLLYEARMLSYTAESPDIVMGYNNESKDGGVVSAEAMDKHLLKLKSVILKSAISNWSQTHTEERTRENAVVKALHSLLRIAEQYSTSKALADFNESNDLDNTASEDAALQSPLRPRARSFTSTKTHGKNSNATTPRTPVPKRPISGESCDADYFSTRMSVFCESEMELSENEHDDNYITADEGYEADGEIPEISESETELDKAEFWNSFQPSSRYRTHLLHDGLCQLVVEILIELSERCIHNPVGWSDCLVQLANRLFVIRAHIGDSLFLLRGFAPVLKCGDPRLRELQQALLELIVDINTPEVICTYFNILSAKNPPVDLLIRYLNHKCDSKLKKPQPMVELEFPMTIDGKCTSTSDQRLTMEIDRIRNQHINAQATTPLSRTPCIIPITHARLWGNDGFTLSFWLQLKGTNINKSSSLIAEDDQRSSLENNLKTHIVSIGTNQVMLSVYVDSNMKLVFETSKPNAEIQTQAQSPSEIANGNMEEKNQSSAKDAVTDSKTPTPLVRPTTWETIANLTAMGPDFSELAPLQVNSWQPNYGFVNLSKLKKANFGSVAESIKLLYEARMLCYTAESPDIVMGYNNESKDGGVVSDACSQPIINKRGEILEISENTSAIVVYPQLIISILHRYSDWHRSGVEHSEVLDMLFLSILALTSEKHPHRDLNLYQLSEAGLLKELLNLCKVYVIESPNPVYISASAAESFVAILSVFAGSPPSTSLMDEIMKLALLLQKPSECYITHDRSKFYFLLTSQPPVREKLSTVSSFNRVATPFRRRSKRERPGIAVPIAVPTPDANTNAKQNEKIKRLRRLHISAASSPFRRNLLELEDNLENVADCGRLNKKALRLLSPLDIENWRTRFKHSSNWNMPASPVKKLHTSNNTEKYLSVSPWSPNKISHKRLRYACFSQSVNMDNPKVKKREKHLGTTSITSIDFVSSDKEILARHNLGLSSVPVTSQQRRSRLLVKTDFYNWHGIIALQEGLLTLLKNFLCLLPDNAVEEVLKHYVKVDIILVLSNNGSCAVRTAIIKLLAVLLKRLQQSDIVAHVKSLYPQHLANQMSLYATDMQMFEACLEWVTGTYNSSSTVLSSDMTLHLVDRFGINALLSIVINMANNQNSHKAKAFKILNKMFNTDTEQQQLLIDAGLLLCCTKSLFNLYLGSNVVDSLLEESILALLTKIGEKSLKSVGLIKVVWDILNMLTFLHEGASAVVIKNLRSAQARLQLKWISMFFEPANEPTTFKVIVLPNSTLSINETKERLRLLIDRCAQFFTICDTNYTSSAAEIELFQLIVSYSISTSQRCNNFIAWGLQPSRPRELRAFIVDALWSSCQSELLPPVVCDGKIIKSFLWLCLLEDLEKPLRNLERLCKLLGINEHDSTWNLENELERIELNRSAVAAEQKAKLEETVFRLEPLAVSCIESSMLTTRRVAELQNSERKLLMYQLKDYDDASIYTRWLGVVRRMTHEGAPWHSAERSENSWELDDTEGPSRVHTRLRRCHLDIDKRFFMEDYYTTELRNNDIPLNSSTSSIAEYVRPLEYLLSSYDQQLNISLNSQILYNFPAKFLPVDGEIDGEIIITDHKLYFMATYRCKYFYINCDISSISEIWLKRYQHQEKAFEIFLDTNQSLFFSLQNQEDYKIMYDVFCDKIVTHPDQAKILVITQQWREGLLTNWEYLMTLNQIAGRTYNDLMQYPIFPWIISNYISDILDLTDTSNFRKLEKPVAVQHEENEQHYINNYTYINNTMTNMGSMTLKPYHYSSHYSNSGTVLHFLVRVPPFTSYFLRYQDNNFDLPDRTFHSLNTTWNLASRDSPTDVKELIPEFFCLPEMFENFERFNFGCRQNGERVEDVQLPPWCLRDARLFVLIHRQALEAELARNQLHHWIDLIFGYKQSGENAIEAINVFHPATYPSFLASITSDPIERKAVETMIKTYGQMPRQLFKNPHPQTKSLNYCLGAKDVLPTVRGLRWGVYLGSPQLHAPTLGNIYKIPGAEYLVSFNNTNVVYGLPTKSCIMQGAEVDTFNVISWDYEDHIVRIQPLNKLNTKPKNILRSNIIDDITACGADPNSNQLWFGHKSGRISIYKCSTTDMNNRIVKSRQNYIRGLRRSYNSAFRKLTTKSYAEEGDTSHTTPLLCSTMGTTSDGLQRDSADLTWNGPAILLRHTDEVTSIRLSVEFKIAVSAGRDGIAVIWDLNNWNYIRTIDRPAEIHQSPITVITISPTLGDIVTVHTTPQQLAPKLMPERQTKTVNGNDDVSQHKSDERTTSPTVPDECFEVTEESLDDFVNVSINPNGKSILRLHTVNARYVQHIVHEDRILAATYSYIKEGVGVNVIATAVEGGTIRLWSSWNLSFVSEIVTGISNIKSIVYSTHQHLVALTKDSHIQVWETEGLYGNSPKFPQIAYK